MTSSRDLWTQPRSQATYIELVGLSYHDGKRPDRATLRVEGGEGIGASAWDVTCPDTLAPSHITLANCVGIQQQS